MRKANISTLCAKFFSCASVRRALTLAEHSCVVGETQAGRLSEDCSGNRQPKSAGNEIFTAGESASKCRLGGKVYLAPPFCGKSERSQIIIRFKSQENQ